MIPLPHPRLAPPDRVGAGRKPWSQFVELDNIELRELTPGDPVELGDGVSVTAVRSPHRDEYSDTVGFVVAGPTASVFYLPDTDSWGAWDRPLAEVAGGADVALWSKLPGRYQEQNAVGGALFREETGGRCAESTEFLLRGRAGGRHK